MNLIETDGGLCFVRRGHPLGDIMAGHGERNVCVHHTFDICICIHTYSVYVYYYTLKLLLISISCIYKSKVYNPMKTYIKCIYLKYIILIIIGCHDLGDGHDAILRPLADGGIETPHCAWGGM